MRKITTRLMLLFAMIALTTATSYSQVSIGASTYTTLKAAFDDINAGIETGDIVIEINESTVETAVAVLNGTGIGNANYQSVTIYPTAPGLSISGTIANALIQFNDADNVIFDGRVNMDGNENSLTLQNNQTATASVVRINNATGGDGANNITVRNLNIIGFSPITNTIFGIYVGGAASLTATGTGSNINLAYNNISKAYNGIRVLGTSAVVSYNGVNISNNNFGGNGTAGNGVAISVHCSYCNNAVVSNNFIKSSINTLFFGIQLTFSPGAIVSNNTIKDLVSTGAVSGTAINILNNASSPATQIFNNLIENVMTGNNCIGIDIASSVSGAKIFNNTIKQIRSSSTGGWSALGINILGGTNHEIYNNEINNITSTNYSTTSTLYNPFGIRIAAGSGHKLYFNTVNLYGNQVGTNSSGTLSAALMVTVTTVTGLDIRNNVFSNSLVGLAGSKSYAIYLMGAGNLTNSTIDYNSYFASGPYAVFGFLTSDRANIVAWRTATSQDVNSIGTNPFLTSNTNLKPDLSSPLLLAGIPIAGITTDLENITRNATAPTIGAYESAVDLSGPAFTFNVLGNTTSLANRTLPVVITDGTSVNTTNFPPRLYFKKSTNENAYVDNTNATNGWKYVEAVGTEPDFTFTIDYSKLFGGLVAGETIQYFMVAQDVINPANFSINGATLATPANNTSLTSSHFPVTNILFSYTVSLQYSGVINVGTGNTFTSLTATNGLFAALNNGVITGNLAINITSDLTETGAVALGQMAEEGDGNYTISILPYQSARTLNFNNTGSCLYFNQTDRVILDGRINGEGNNLTIINTNTLASNLIDIAGSGSNGATNIIIRNVNLIGGSNTNTSTHGIIVRDNTGATTANATNHNIQLIENTIKKVYYGIRVLGTGAGLEGFIADGNIIGDEVLENSVIFRGIVIGGAIAPQIINNHIFNMVVTSGSNISGIELATLPMEDAVIENNIIASLSHRSTGGYGAWGINLAVNATDTYIANNIISDIHSFGWNQTSYSDNDFGIRLTSGDGINLYHNTINMAGTVPTNTLSGKSSAIGVTTTAVQNVNIFNNIIINTTNNPATGGRSQIYWLPSTTWAGPFAADNNHYLLGETNKFFFASFGNAATPPISATFADWQTAMELADVEQNSTYGEVYFVAHNNPLITGTSIDDVTLIKPLLLNGPATDIHGEVRTVANNFAGADIAIPTGLVILQDLPTFATKGTNTEHILEFIPSVTFADGMDRMIPCEDLNVQWYFEDDAIAYDPADTPEENNYIVIDCNNLTISSVQPSHEGVFHATASWKTYNVQTAFSELYVEKLQPTMLSPANLSTDIPKYPTLEWIAALDATSYIVQIATDEEFTSIVANHATTDLTYEPTNLEYEWTYFWRVRGVNDLNQSDWTTPWSFQLRPAVYPVTLLTPANTAANAPIHQTFSWTANDEAMHYIFELATDAMFNNLVETTIHTTNTYNYFGLNYAGTYFWRVRAADEIEGIDYVSEWSETWSFTTPLAPSTQTDITIGTGTLAQDQPINRYYNYSVSESIYLASEIGTAATLNSIAYYKGGGTDVNPITGVNIYLKHTADATLATGEYSLDGYTLVFSGNFPNDAAFDWKTVNFTTNFAYNGVDNLQVLIVKDYQYWTSARPTWRYTSVTPNRQRHAQSDASMPISLTTNANLPNVKFGFLPIPLLPTAPSLTAPANLATDVMDNQVFTWTEVAGATMYKVQISTTPTFTTLVENKIVETNSTTFENFQYSEELYWRVQAINAANASPWSATWSFETTPYLIYGTYYIGDGEEAHFPNLNTIFGLLNGGALVGGDVELVIISDIEEIATAQLNEFEEYFAGGWTITIRPDGNTLRTITANAPNNGVIRLFGADRIIFDGSNVSETEQYLHIRNTSELSGAALWLSSPYDGTMGLQSAGDEPTGCNNIAIYNTKFSTQAGPSVTSSYGIVISGPSIDVQGDLNSFVSVENCHIFSAYIGIAVNAVNPYNNFLFAFENNLFGCDEVGNRLVYGVMAQYAGYMFVNTNEFRNMVNTAIAAFACESVYAMNNIAHITNPNITNGYDFFFNAIGSNDLYVYQNFAKHFKHTAIMGFNVNEFDVIDNEISHNLGNDNNSIAGIRFISFYPNSPARIEANKIHSLSSSYLTSTAGASIMGIYLTGSPTNSESTPIIVENNMVWNLSAFGTPTANLDPTALAQNIHGIFVSNGRNINVYNNTVLLNGSLLSGNGYSSALTALNPGINNLNVRNNIFANRTSAGINAKNYIYLVTNPTIFGNIDDNIYNITNTANTKLALATAANTVYSTIPAWQTATTKEAAAKMKSVPFLPELPFTSAAVLNDADFISPALLTDYDIQGKPRTSDNNVKGAFIPDGNQIQARFAVFSNITTTSMTSSWINGNGQGRLVLISDKPVSAINWVGLINNLDYELDTYTNVDGTWGSKVPVQYGSAIAYVIANQTAAGRIAQLSGLTPSTRYFVHIVEYYADNGYVSYNAMPSTMNPRFVDTQFDVTPPTIAPATNVAHDMFTANWTYSSTQAIDGFELYLNDEVYDLGNVVISNGNLYSFDIFALPQTAYSYKVRAKKGGFASNWSAYQNVISYPMNALAGLDEVCLNSPNQYQLSLGDVVVSNILWTSFGSINVTGQNPATITWLEAGNFDITAFITDNQGNTGSISMDVLVNELPVVTCADDFEICLSADDFELTGGMPLGGTYSGTGVAQGMFDPAIAGIGNHLITYTFVDENGCSNSCSFTISVMNAITITVPDDIFVCIDVPSFTLEGATPLGGTYSGTGVADGIFNPALAGAGIHTITYSFTDGFGCTNTNTFEIEVEALPIVEVPDNFAVCVTSGSLILATYVTPSTGIFTGDYVEFGVFDPTIAGVGEHTIFYEVISANGCSTIESFKITVDPLPVITVPANFEVCVDAPAFMLTGSMPTGGTYSGVGVVDGTFDAALAGVGAHTITYSYTELTCTLQNTFTIIVNPLPIITVPANFEVCLNTEPFMLTGALPEGGVYSGDGVSVVGNFEAIAAGVGTHTITYTYEDENGCENSNTFTITVKELPVVTCPTSFEVCLNSNGINLHQLDIYPAGGTFTGDNILNMMGQHFLPNQVGTFEITYTYTDPITNCNNFCTFEITVNPLPELVVAGDIEICINANAITLAQVTPTGGTYSGTGVENGVFNPATAGAGTHAINYTYTDANGCTSIAQFNIVVIPLPVILTQPQNLVVPFNGAGAFAVTAMNATGFEWQYSVDNGTTWQSAGSTTNSLILTDVPASYNGRLYREVISGCSQIISNVATLNVVTTPTQSTNISWLNWGRTEITFNWTRGDGNGCIVVAVQGAWPYTFEPQNFVDYIPQSNTFGRVENLVAPGHYVVYNGNGNYLTVNGLTRNTQYSFHVFEYNTQGGFVVYNKLSAAGNPASRSTARKDDVFDHTTKVNDASFELSQVSPNPASDFVSFSINAEQVGEFTIELVNTLGEVIHSQRATLGIGVHPFDISINTPTGNLPSGMYLLRVTSDGISINRNVVIVK